MDGARAEPLTAEQLQQLSDDPKNKVYREEYTQRDAWDPAVVESMLRALHTAFVAHVVAQPDASVEADERVAVQLVRDAGGDMVRMATQHPSLVGKVTTRTSAIDARQMQMVWTMLELRRQAHSGEMSDDDAQRALVAQTLTSFLTPPPPNREPARDGKDAVRG